MSETKTESLTCRACGYSVDTTKTVDKPNDALITCPGCKGVAALAAFRTEVMVKAHKTVKSSLIDDGIEACCLLIGVSMMALSVPFMLVGLLSVMSPYVETDGRTAGLLGMLVSGNLFTWGYSIVKTTKTKKI